MQEEVNKEDKETRESSPARKSSGSAGRRRESENSRRSAKAEEGRLQLQVPIAGSFPDPGRKASASQGNFVFFLSANFWHLFPITRSF